MLRFYLTKCEFFHSQGLKIHHNNHAYIPWKYLHLILASVFSIANAEDSSSRTSARSSQMPAGLGCTGSPLEKNDDHMTTKIKNQPTSYHFSPKNHEIWTHCIATLSQIRCKSIACRISPKGELQWKVFRCIHKVALPKKTSVIVRSESNFPTSLGDFFGIQSNTAFRIACLVRRRGRSNCKGSSASKKVIRISSTTNTTIQWIFFWLTFQWKEPMWYIYIFMWSIFHLLVVVLTQLGIQLMMASGSH